MENFNQIFTLLAKSEGIGLNLDILETGLINIIALVAILIYTGKDFLGSSLRERKRTIVNSIQDAEDRLNEANKRLSEAQKQLSQFHIAIRNIEFEKDEAIDVMHAAELLLVEKEAITRITRAVSTLRTKQQRLFDQVKHKIVSTVLTRTVVKFKEDFGTRARALRVTTRRIEGIGGSLYNA